MEWIITLLIIVPAVALAASGSTALIHYAVWVVALNRCLRRMVDFYFNEQFNPFSPISLTPLVVGGLLFLCSAGPVLRMPPGRTSRIFKWLIGAVAVGFTVGVIYNPIGAVYSLGEWMAGLGAMMFAATHARAVEAGDGWLKSAGWAGVIVAAYGWWQYLTIPEWDAMWLVQSGMQGYLGHPEPTRMICFSTMNERGVCATFLGWAMLPMLLSPRWRTLVSFPAIILILSTMLLTGVRTMYIIVTLAAVIFPLVNRGRQVFQILLIAAVVTLAGSSSLNSIPGVERFTSRFEEDSVSGEGSSLDARRELYAVGFAQVLHTPLGYGLGSSGMASRVSATGKQSIGDAGYIQIINSFGWGGAVLFFGALALLWRETSQRFALAVKCGDQEADPFVTAARAILLAMLVFLVVGNVFGGFSLVWIIFGRALHPFTEVAATAEKEKEESGGRETEAPSPAPWSPAPAG